MTLIRIAAAPNTKVPAVLLLEERGYLVTNSVSDRGETWIARRVGVELLADGPLELLGLAALADAKGERWRAEDREIERFLRKHYRGAPEAAGVKPQRGKAKGSSVSASDVVPRHKQDFARVRAAVEAGYPAIEALLPELLVWLADANWPVAQELAPFLATIGAPLAPHVKTILRTANEDEGWKHNLLTLLVAQNRDLALSLREELEHFAAGASGSELAESLAEIAAEILARSRQEP